MRAACAGEPERASHPRPAETRAPIEKRSPRAKETPSAPRQPPKPSGPTLSANARALRALIPQHSYRVALLPASGMAEADFDSAIAELHELGMLEQSAPLGESNRYYCNR